jgi:putative FmdB family regulatory protein
VSFLLLDYACTKCGHVFESFENRSAPAALLPCPQCHAGAERALSPVRSMTVWGYAATRAKSNAPHENPVVLNTQPLADGMKHSEWKKRRREFRAEERRKENKRDIG